ncbi:MAG: hypothetical protein HYX47_14360 [Burkholderiales bacterium]|nr:hypothetical protein [Burkholderiales bacterium]
MLPLSLALLATVGLLISMGFFMLGSLPLLILKHDTPLDARFIRGLFHYYYRAVLVTSTAATIAYAFAKRPAFSLGMCVVAVLALIAHRLVIGRMDALRGTMTPEDAVGIHSFRRWHVGGMAFNVLQLATVAYGLTGLSL